MNASRYLIRLFSGGIESWFKDTPPDLQQLASDVERLAKVFDLGEREHSVYELAGDEEEALVAAAHGLASKQPKVDACSVLRIQVDELQQFGIGLDRSQLGSTGVIWIDHRHRNLLADRDGILQLVRYLSVECVRNRGQDRLRRLYKLVVSKALVRFLELRAVQCPAHVKKLCQRALAGSSPLPAPDLAQVEEELDGIEFPHDVVEPVAASKSSGDPDRDWYEAVALLRRDYARHYIQALRKRFRL